MDKVHRAAKITQTLDCLKKALKHAPEPMSHLLIHDFGRDPFIILISCLISLRARDTATYPISRELLRHVRTPQELLAIPISKLEKILFSVGFYRQKARILHEVCHELINRFNSQVPADRDDLLSIKHIGHKTAALVRAEGFGIPAICVDVHVHRLAHHFGWVQTKTPEQTEAALEALIPRSRWSDINHVLVKLGQSGCRGQHEHCAICHAYSTC